MIQPLLETWRMNEAMNRYLLGILTAEQWEVKLSQGKGVRSQFAHMHNMRVRWMRTCAPDQLEGLDLLNGHKASKEEVAEQMALSADAVARVLERAGSPGTKIKSFAHASAFLGYACAHDACHRGQVEIALRQARLAPDYRVMDKMWTFGRSLRK